ncbi:MAG: transglutaminase domain-containing protein [Phycisphaera sp. RhM]|nr:transglutaminase domain-containing protein [Phycisphaera sp. RhM]
MPIWSRRRVETILLAALAIASVIPLRYFVESRGWFLGEIAVLCTAFVVAEFAKSTTGQSKRVKQATALATLLVWMSPILFALFARAFGSPIALEMSALTTFGAISLAVAVAATTQRTQSLSLVISGFLVLFSASISDSPHAVVLPIVWMLGCIWHLIANHWERLGLAMPDSVERNWTLRPSLLIVTVAVLAGGAYTVKDRATSSERFANGFMPTSGGSGWSDPAARSGVGTGDAAIAAKDHAESFGAVDSDIFLESTESTLFDMANDMLGDPKKKTKWERRQAMGNDNTISMHEQASKSEQGGGTFSIERIPPKKHRHFENTKDASVVQWDGPTGIRLALHRYDQFNGKDWIQSANPKTDSLTRIDLDGAPWFFDPMMRNTLNDSSGAISVGLLKVIRLDSQRLPVPMLTAGIHIKELDRQDFFGIAEDGSFLMPGREKVPPLTVVHVASVGLTEDQIRETLRVDPADDEKGDRKDLLNQYVYHWTKDLDAPYEKLQSIVAQLRTKFTFDRAGQSAATTLDEFLRSRRGGDHLFATTAALMAREIGLSSRLVTGFYVRPDSLDRMAGHASVLPQDVHVWAEVRLRDGRWFEIEPTPSYEQPRYQPSWRLLARRFLVAHRTSMAGGLLGLSVVFFTRSLWIDWLLTVVWKLARWLRPRRRICFAIRIIETRATIAGYRRPAGQSQRVWLEKLTAADPRRAEAAQRFADAADALIFGDSQVQSYRGATELVDLLPVRTITALTKEARL